MEVRVCSLPSESFGYILLQLKKKVHLLPGEVGHLHWVFVLGLQLVDHDYYEADSQEEENGRDDCGLPDGIVFALRGSIAVGLTVDVAAAGVAPVAV